MYKIKPNGNYNLVIADLNITLCSNSDVILTDLEFESSNDIKNILHYLNVQKIDSTEYQEVDVIKEEATDIPVAFVAHSHEISNDKGFFVKDTESTEVINVDKTIEEAEVTVEVTTMTDTVDTSIETVCNNIVETNMMETIVPTEMIEPEISTLKNEEKKVSKSNSEKKAKKEIAKSKKISSKKKDNKVQ